MPRKPKTTIQQLIYRLPDLDYINSINEFIPQAEKLSMSEMDSSRRSRAFHEHMNRLTAHLRTIVGSSLETKH